MESDGAESGFSPIVGYYGWLVPDERAPQTPRHPDALLRNLWEPARRIARQRAAKRPWLRDETDDLANYALEKLRRAMRAGEVRNPEAFMSIVIYNRILDMALSRDAEANRLVVAADELPVKRVMRGSSSDIELPRRGGPLRGLSADVIAEEEREMVQLLAAAAVAVMPSDAERAMLWDRLYLSSSLSITELARRHGKTPNVMANWLAKTLGTEGSPGALAPLRTMLDALSTRVARRFVRLLVADDGDAISRPFDAAQGHLELFANRSNVPRRQAAEAQARLRWVQTHLPPRHGMKNKVIHRLAVNACVYIIDVEDAHDDRLHDGLRDDLTVLNAVSRILRASTRNAR